MIITFTVPGRPTRWQRPGQGQLPDGTTYRFTDPTAVAGKKAIAFQAKRAFGLKRPATGPVLLRVVGIFGIPKSWPPKLISSARQGRVFHTSDPDLDQLVKQVQDALVGIAYVDDNQVCGYPNSAKRYGYPERTEITVQYLPQVGDDITPGQKRLEGHVAQYGWDEILRPPEKRKARPKRLL